MKRTARQRRRAEQSGRRAEWWAALYLMAKGWRILKRRHRLPMMEIDLLVRRGNTIAVVEVKKRATLDQATQAFKPEAALRLQQAARQVAGQTVAASRTPITVRIDLIAMAPWRWPRHIENVI